MAQLDFLPGFPPVAENPRGKILAVPDVESGMAAIQAVERALRAGDETTRPEVDAEKIRRIAARHGLGHDDLVLAAAEILDVSKRPVLPLALAVWRVWGDQGAAVLKMAAGGGR